MMRATHVPEAKVYEAADKRLRAVARRCGQDGQELVACHILDALDRGNMPLRFAVTIWRASTFQTLSMVGSSPTGWVVAMWDDTGSDLGGWTWDEATGHQALERVPGGGSP